MPEKITSLQNPLIKNINKLHKSAERKKQNLAVVEGGREILCALEAGNIIQKLLLSDSAHSSPFFKTISAKIEKQKTVEISGKVFQKITYRDNADGMLAIIEPQYLFPDDIKLSVNPLIIVLDAIEKPGNIGAIFRTADAAGADAVIICDPQTDLYNPNIIRASLGTLFTTQAAISSGEEAFQWLKNNKIKVFAAALQTEKNYFEMDFTVPSAIIMGSEAHGLSDSRLKNADEIIKIPMKGNADSLNVSVSTAVIVYEAVRQRSGKR